MSKSLRLTLFWIPRVLGILFILFISLFALDIFDMGLGFWGTILGLFMHLLPSIAMLIGLILAWRWEWVGTLVYGAFGVWFLSISQPGDVMYYIILVGVPVVIALLFLLSWIYRKQRREDDK